jgi:signal transduction histidine kinase
LFAIVDTLKTGSTQRLSDYAESLGEMRLQQGFAIEEVVESLLLLRETVVQTLFVRANETSESQSELLRFDACHRALLTRFVAEYAENVTRGLRAEKDRTALMLQTAELVGGSLELAIMLPRVAGQLTAALGSSHCGIYLWNDSHDLLERRAVAGEDSEVARLLEQPLEPTKPLIVDVHASGRAIVCPASDSHFLFDARSCGELPVSALVVIPIVLGARLVALAVAFHTEDPHEPDSQRLRLAEGVAQSVAPAIENALRYTHIRQEAIRTQRLQRATSRLLDMQGLDDVFEIVCREARDLGRSPGTAVVLHRERNGRDSSFSSGLATGRVEELWNRSKAGDPSVLALPLTVKDQRLGTLLLIAPESSTDEDVLVLNLFSEQAASAIAHALLHEQDERLAVLEERQKLSRELHDSVTQSLYGATLYSETALRLLESGHRERATQALRELKKTALEALREMRLLVFELRPSVLEAEGLASALEARLAAVEGRAGIETDFHAEDVGDLPHSAAETLYSIAREVMNNVLKHASASKIRLVLKREPDAVILEITDDGVGFDEARAARSGGLGILGMKERAAEIGAALTIASQPDAGTCVRVEVPTQARASERRTKVPRE